MLKEFKAFMMQGNVLDLAVGVVIGSAFTAIITKIVDGLLTPLISLFFITVTKQRNADEALGALVFKVNGVSFQIGTVISAIITFVITAFVLFILVKTVNNMQKRRKKQPEDTAPPQPTTEEYLAEIRDLLASQNEKRQK